MALFLSLNGIPATVNPAMEADQNPDGSFTFALTSAQTAQIAPGAYLATISVTDAGGNRSNYSTDQVLVLPDPSKPMAQTVAQQQLALFEAALLQISPRQSVMINGQSYSFRQLKDLQDARDRAQARVDAELRALGLSRRGGAQTIVTRFSS